MSERKLIRPISPREARMLFSTAIKLDGLARGRENSFSEERDEILADLRSSGYSVSIPNFDQMFNESSSLDGREV